MSLLNPGLLKLSLEKMLGWIVPFIYSDQKAGKMSSVSEFSESVESWLELSMTQTSLG